MSRTTYAVVAACGLAITAWYFAPKIYKMFNDKYHPNNWENASIEFNMKNNKILENIAYPPPKPLQDDSPHTLNDLKKTLPPVFNTESDGEEENSNSDVSY